MKPRVIRQEDILLNLLELVKVEEPRKYVLNIKKFHSGSNK